MKHFFLTNLDWIIYLLGFLSPIVLKVLVSYVSEVIKSSIGNKDKNTDEKRKAYIQLINSMGIFIEGKYKGELYRQAQQNFNVAYDYLWLWGNQNLIQAVGKYLDRATRLTELDRKESLTQEEQVEKESLKDEMEDEHVKIIILLRKDLGLKTNNLSSDNYNFFKLG